MPLRTFPVSLAAIGRQVLVPNGNRITDISILADPLGLPFNFTIDLGNNQLIGPITEPCVVELDGDLPIEDVSEGVAVINAAVQAGVSVPIVVSYNRGNGRGGVRVIPA